jgi:hypothetical protein
LRQREVDPPGVGAAERQILESAVVGFAEIRGIKSPENSEARARS